MPISDISQVTSSIMTMIDNELEQRYGEPSVVVTAAAPDQIEGVANTVSVHLFHVIESPDFKNIQPASRSHRIPIQGSLMGLVMQYLITIVNEMDQMDKSGDALRQQRLTGFVTRTLHDFPVLTPDSKRLDARGEPVLVPPTTGGDPVPVFYLAQDLRDAGDSLELILRPAAMEETISFWSVNQKRLARASLFVEARVVVLEPRPAEVASGIVLTVGDFVFPGSGPELTGSRSIVAFFPPAGDPPTTQPARTLLAIPAKVALFALAVEQPEPPTPIDGNNRMTLEGTGIGRGHRFLVLKSRNLEVKIDIDEPAPVNEAWEFQTTSAGIELRFRRRVEGSVAGVVSIVDLSPGPYTARVIVEDDRFGEVPRPSATGAIPFMVTPQILALGPLVPEVANEYSLTVSGDYLDVFQADPDVELAIGGRALLRKFPDVLEDEELPTLEDGTFGVFGPTEIRFRLGTATPPPGPGNPLSVRLVVNGATAPPAWLEDEAEG